MKAFNSLRKQLNTIPSANVIQCPSETKFGRVCCELLHFYVRRMYEGRGHTLVLWFRMPLNPGSMWQRTPCRKTMSGQEVLRSSCETVKRQPELQWKFQDVGDSRSM